MVRAGGGGGGGGERCEQGSADSETEAQDPVGVAAREELQRLELQRLVAVVGPGVLPLTGETVAQCYIACGGGLCGRVQ